MQFLQTFRSLSFFLSAGGAIWSSCVVWRHCWGGGGGSLSKVAACISKKMCCKEEGFNMVQWYLLTIAAVFVRTEAPCIRMCCCGKRSEWSKKHPRPWGFFMVHPRVWQSSGFRLYPLQADGLEPPQPVEAEGVRTMSCHKELMVDRWSFTCVFCFSMF